MVLDSRCGPFSICSHRCWLWRPPAARMSGNRKWRRMLSLAPVVVDHILRRRRPVPARASARCPSSLRFSLRRRRARRDCGLPPNGDTFSVGGGRGRGGRGGGTATPSAAAAADAAACLLVEPILLLGADSDRFALRKQRHLCAAICLCLKRGGLLQNACLRHLRVCGLRHRLLRLSHVRFQHCFELPLLLKGLLKLHHLTAVAVQRFLQQTLHTRKVKPGRSSVSSTPSSERLGGS
mmetsp:Transcript_46822/g.94461  ORF Transcript_46822/g.94461 Transcript_46822/m.94461 type:complete len:237 (-) Transcript_46822:147-857(-)